MGAEAERWAARTDAQVRGRALDELEIFVALSDTRATIAALRLYEVDKELRRVAAIAWQQGETGTLAIPRGGRPRPIPPSRGGLVIESMQAGSLEFFLAAGGEVIDVLTSRPTQALLALTSLLGNSAQLRVWLRRTLRRGQGQVDRSNKGDGPRGLGEPDMILLPGGEGDTDHGRLPDGVAVVRIAGETVEAAGRVVRLTRHYGDGTSDVWEVTG